MKLEFLNNASSIVSDVYRPNSAYIGYISGINFYIEVEEITQLSLDEMEQIVTEIKRRNE